MKRILLALACTLILDGGTAARQTAAARLQTTPPQLVGCGTDERPFFRTLVSGLDVNGQAAKIALGADPKTKGFSVRDETKYQNVLYVSDPGDKGLYVTLLLDTSGSMNIMLPGTHGTRFDAAKDAIGKSLNGFVDGSDHVAVAPFESRNVKQIIDDARFGSSRLEVQRAVEALRRPEGQNNTGLYSAIVDALPQLTKWQHDGFPVALVVFTDGANDVDHPNHDDPGLLSGSQGLEEAKSGVARAEIPVFTVGFTLSEAASDAAAVSALQEIAKASNGGAYTVATSPADLEGILRGVRRRLADQVEVFFGPVAASRSELGAQPLRFHVSLQPSQGAPSVIESREEPRWNNPGMGDIASDVNCSREEARTIPPLPTTGGPSGPLTQLMVLLTYSAALAGLWFGAPRFVWPEAYIPQPVLPQVPTPPMIGGVGVPVPPLPSPPGPPDLGRFVPPQRVSPRAPASPVAGPSADQTVVFPGRGPVRPTPRAPESTDGGRRDPRQK